MRCTCYNRGDRLHDEYGGPPRKPSRVVHEQRTDDGRDWDGRDRGNAWWRADDDGRRGDDWWRNDNDGDGGRRYGERDHPGRHLGHRKHDKDKWHGLDDRHRRHGRYDDRRDERGAWHKDGRNAGRDADRRAGRDWRETRYGSHRAR